MTDHDLGTPAAEPVRWRCRAEFSVAEWTALQLERAAQQERAARTRRRRKPSSEPEPLRFECEVSAQNWFGARALARAVLRCERVSAVRLPDETPDPDWSMIP